MRTVLTLLVLFRVATLADAQPVLTMSAAAERAGQPISVTVVFQPEGADVRTLTMKFKWPAELEFVEAKPGVAAELAGLRLTTVTGSSEFELASDKSAIPEGFLLAVDLNIRKSATAGKTVKVEFTALGTPAKGEQVAVRTDGGEVEITAEAPPVIACFFYLH